MSDTKEYVRRYITYNGKRYSRRGKTEREALAKLAKLEASLKSGETVITGKMTVKAWAEEWVEVYKRPVVGESQYKRYKRIIDNIIVPEIGNQQIRSVKDVQLQRILNSRIGYSKSDISKLRDTLRGIFRRAHASGLIAKNPAEYIDMPAAKEGTNRSITDNERDKILALAETHDAGLWIKIALYTGIRPGEARALDWQHVDIENRVLHVKTAMKAGVSLIDKPKGNSSVRNIPIMEALVPSLLAAKRTPFEPVLINPKSGKRHTESTMYNLWDSFKYDLDVSMGAKVEEGKIILSAVALDLVPYCLRHTYCTDLQDAGVPINVARYLMGHSDIRVTAKIYTHTTDNALADALVKSNAWQTRGEPQGEPQTP